ncbi:MAG TPA: DinB family protein [Candidatus Angelobacter sp.]|jgi:uncharacterized damage-inducible protein DinB|nr:DinB family protein [Candidatus Angelobacter sp.]
MSSANSTGPQLTAEQARFLFNMNASALRSEHQLTKQVIGAIPSDKADYRPDAVSKSAIELAWHIVVSERRFLSSIAAGAFDFTPMPRAESLRTTADVLDWYEKDFSANLQRLHQLRDEDLLKIIDFRGMFQLPAVLYLNFILNHTIHHRGQLSMYLRPMGAKVPSIYGESYDAAQARLAKEGKA